MQEVKASKVADTPANVSLCLCGSCPTYPGVKGEALYCGRGISSTEIVKKGCICQKCEVFQQNGCADGYFCSEGTCK